MIKILLYIYVLASFLVASTVGIATGNKTIDGRPLLFKNKDRADNYPSDVNYYSGTSNEYNYVFQVNNGQDHTRARMGINSVGFGVGYTTSENLSGAGSGPSGSQFSAIALKTCSTIQDFRDLLNATNGTRTVHEHYAIIDSSGAGSMFEVDGYTWIEISIVDSIGTMANTAKYHPSAGPPASGSTSPQREARAEYLLTHGDSIGLDYKYFVNDIIKDFCETQVIEDSMPIGQYQTNPVLSRYKTACGGVIKGCKPGDDPLIESIMWLTLHEPSSTIALPFNPNVNEVFSFVRPSSPGEGMAGSSDRIRMLVYDYTNGRYSDRYADTYSLVDIRSHTFPLQDSLFTTYEQELSQWRNMTASQAKPLIINWTYSTQLWAKTKYDSILIVLNIEESDNIATGFRLLQNYPNPFNPSTTIKYIIAKPGIYELAIYNLLGKKVRTLFKEHIPAGTNTCVWNGRNEFGEIVTSGVYFYRLVMGKYKREDENVNLTKKMIIIR